MVTFSGSKYINYEGIHPFLFTATAIGFALIIIGILSQFYKRGALHETKEREAPWQSKGFYSYRKKNGRGHQARFYLEDILKGHSFKQLDESSCDLKKNIIFSHIKGLGECYCVVNRRFKVPKIRGEFENKIVRNLICISKESDDIEITFLASGFLFGEFVILLKFVAELKANPWKGRLNVNLIDPINASFQSKKQVKLAIETFEKELLLNLDKQIELKIRIFSYAEGYSDFLETHPTKKCDFLISIEPGMEAYKAYKEIKTNGLKRDGCSAFLSKEGYYIPVIKFQKRVVYEKSTNLYLFIVKNTRSSFYSQTEVMRKRSIILNYEYHFASNTEIYQTVKKAIKSRDFSVLKTISPHFFKPGPLSKIKFQVN